MSDGEGVMTRNQILISLAALAIVAAAPAFAKPGGGGGGGGGGGHGQGMGGGMGGGWGHASRGMDNSMSSNATRIRGNSTAGIGPNTFGHGNTKNSGITSGLTVVDASGATVGTATAISTNGNSGNIRNVQITLNNGDVIFVSPRSLTLNNGVLTTTTLTSNAHALNRRVNSQGPFHASVQGLAHASPNSVLAAGGSTITGLTLGIPVVNGSGDTLGPVTQLINNRSGQLVGIRVDLNDGGIVTIPARTLAFNGGVLTTTFVPH
jgi:hypothetical protein